MPRKYRHSNYPSKPASTAHPSLSPSTSSSVRFHGGDDGVATTASVNEILQRLRDRKRRVHTVSDAEYAAAALTSRTEASHRQGRLASSALNHLNNTNNNNNNNINGHNRHQQQDQGARERWAARVHARPLPGPAAPASWSSISRSHSSLSSQEQSERDAALDRLLNQDDRELLGSRRRRRIDRLPGFGTPPMQSLTYQILKKIALDWSDFVHCEGENLSLLPVHLKKTLLALLVIYGPVTIPLQDLEVLCYETDELDGGTGVRSISHVHIAYATNPDTGNVRGYKDLAQFLVGKDAIRPTSTISPTAGSSSGANLIPDSWQDEFRDELEPLASGLRPIKLHGAPRFQLMTHLDLSHAAYASWKHLVRDLTPHLQQLTHLSLAHWPAPSLTSSSRGTVLTSSAHRNLDGQILKWNSSAENDWGEAITLFQRLGKHLPRLRWLDLEGCSGPDCWVDALGCTTGSRQVDWSGTFRGLETLIISQGSTPVPLKLENMQEFLQEWIVMALVSLYKTSSVATWIGSLPRKITASQLEAFSLKSRFQYLDGAIVKQFWLWLEHELRALQTARNIRIARGDGCEKLDIVCTDRPSWAVPLLHHPRRGIDVDEQAPASLDTIRRIISPGEMALIGEMFQRQIALVSV